MNHDDNMNINLSGQSLSKSNRSVDHSFRSGEAMDFFGIAYDIRRIRDANFPPEYFSDAAWDILLELGCAERKGETLAISELAVRAGLPASTRQRYVHILINDGFVARVPTEKDQYRTQLRLTAKGRETLEKIVDQVIAKYLPQQTG